MKIGPESTRKRTPTSIALKPEPELQVEHQVRERANSEAEIANAAISPPTKVGLRNSVRSNIGSRCSASATTKATSSSAATASEKTTLLGAQPSSLERIRP